MIPPEAKVFVAGHAGLVGSALVRSLRTFGHERIVVRDRDTLDLEDAAATLDFFQAERPEYVFLAAAKVGGILPNSTKPADFIRANLTIQLNVIEAAYQSSVRKLLFLGSSCIYPKHAEQPIKEEALLSGRLEPTNAPYAVAKIAGIHLCQAYNKQFGTDFISVMPTNLYGPGDNFDLESSHVIPALIRKFHVAKIEGYDSVSVWGTGRPRREFLHVDDMADACVYLMTRYSSSEPINVGCGRDMTIASLADLVAKVVEFKGTICFDHSKPDGTPRKLLDISRLTDLGWQAKIPLTDGLRETYQWFLRHGGSQRNLVSTATASTVD